MIAPGATAGLASFALCLTLTPIVRKLCLRWGTVDSPGPLKIHTRPTPRLGGIAVALSIFAAILVSAPHAARENPLFFAAFTTIWLIGLADDLRSLPALARLAGQVVPAILLWLGGWRFSIARVLPGSGAAEPRLCLRDRHRLCELVQFSGWLRRHRRWSRRINRRRLPGDFPQRAQCCSRSIRIRRCLEHLRFVRRISVL